MKHGWNCNLLRVLLAAEPLIGFDVSEYLAINVGYYFEWSSLNRKVQSSSPIIYHNIANQLATYTNKYHTLHL